MKIKTFLFHCFCVFILFYSCEDKVVYPDVLTVTAEDPKEENYTEAGWLLFSNDNYLDAEKNFLAAIAENAHYADAFNGLGWVYMNLDSLQLSKANFTLAIMSSNYESEIFMDASAGRSFVNLALDDYYSAIIDVNNAIDWDYYNGYQEYVFRYDFNITELDLLLVNAESYFLLGDYQQCYEMLILIDPELSINSINPEELAQIIEDLKGSI